MVTAFACTAMTAKSESHSMVIVLRSQLWILRIQENDFSASVLSIGKTVRIFTGCFKSSFRFFIRLNFTNYYKKTFGKLSMLFIIYYKDTSVLLESIPLVKFRKTTFATRVVYFLYFLVAKTIFYSLAALFRKIWLCHSKIKFISSRHRVISSIYLTLNN